MRFSLAFVSLGLLVVGCRTPTTVADDKTVAQTVPRPPSRAEALHLLPDGVNFLASADVKALIESGSFSREVELLRSLQVEPVDKLDACGLEFGSLTYLVLAGDTNTESNFISVLSSPSLGEHTLACLAKNGSGSVDIENGRSVVTGLETKAKLYAVAPGVIAMATPGLQPGFEARLDGRGQAATAASMRDAVEFTDLGADIAFALAPDEELAVDTPGFRSIAVQATLADGLAVKLVSIFETPQMAERAAAAVDRSIWKTVADDIGVSSTIVDSVEVDVQGSVATLQLRATEDELQSISDVAVAVKVMREEVDMLVSDDSRSPEASQGPDELDVQFLERQKGIYRSDWSDGDRQAEYHERCLSKFVPELDERIRETYCLCVARDMSLYDSDATEAAEDCGLKLYPIILRSTGVDECEAVHGEDVCSCWVEARERSSSRYGRASDACLDKRTTENNPARFGPN